MNFGCNLTGVAKCYLRNGFSVVPVKANTKEPLIKWKDYAKTHMNIDLVNEIFYDNFNIALATGEISGITIIDVDDHDLFTELYDFNKLVDEAGVIVKSPRGHHFWFKYDSDLKTKQVKEYGFDIKNDGALITVPPSRYNGHVYHFMKCNGIFEIPRDFKEKVLTLEKPLQLAKSSDEPLLNEVLKRLTVARKLPDGTYRCHCPAHEDQDPSLDVGLKDGRLYIKCWAGCSKDDVLQALGLEKEKSFQKRKDSANEKLLKLCEDFELWMNQNGEAWATLRLGDKAENYRIDSQNFRQLLQFLFYQRFGKSAHTQALSEVIQTLAGKAIAEGKKHHCYIRIGKTDDSIELDLANNGLVARVTKDEILISEPLCKFKRPSGLLPLPEPDLNADKDDWKLLIGFTNTDANGLILILAWILGCFNLDGEFPLLNIVGEREGIGKTTATKLIRTVVDPSNVSVKPLPKTEDDLLTVCLNNYIVAFDNLSHISDSVSDALCRISTGAGLAKRRLFTDTDSVQYAVKNPVILNGIDLFAERRDLRRRCIHVELQKITNPKPVNRILSDFELVHPKLLGWLLKAVQIALNEKIDQITNLTDMASFVEFICKTEKIFPVSANAFITSFIANRQNVSLQIVAENPIVTVILELVEGGEWKGLMAELHEKILQHFQNTSIIKTLPKDSKSLSRKLKRMLTDLENLGLSCEIFRDSSNRSYVHIKRIKENISDNSITPKPLKINGSHFGDISEIKQNISEVSPTYNPLKNKASGDSGDAEIKNQNFLMCDVIDGKDINPDDIVIEE